MERETFDTKELYRLDEAIRGAMGALRGSREMGGGWAGGFQQAGFPQYGSQPGQDLDRAAEMIRERVIEGVRTRVAEAVRERLRHALREKLADAVRERLGEAL